jgi:hypothetical protein
VVTPFTSFNEDVNFSAGADGTGAYTVTVTGAQQAKSLNIARGNVTLAGAGTIATPTVNVAAGATATISATLTGGTTGSLAKTGAGSLTITKFQGNGLAVSGGALQIAAGGGTAGTSVLASAPTVSGIGSKLDLTDHKLIVTNGGASLAAVNALVKSAAASPGAGLNPTWTGDGITTTAAITPADGKLRSIGVAVNSVNAIPIPSYGGQAVGTNDLLIGYTYAGDANMDGGVTFADFSLLQNNFGQSGKLWEDGDFNYDGTVNFADFSLLQNNFGQSQSPNSLVASLTPEQAQVIAAFAAENAPEPTTLGLLGLAGMGLLGRRRRRA